MPTYNRAARLQIALTSVLQQSYGTLEIIVSDNASTDDTADVCRTMAAQDCRVQVYRQSTNVGPVANFEFVKSKASGKYFMWLADDDSLSNNYVRACVERLERSPELILVHAAASYFRADGSDYDEAVFALDQPKPIQRVLSYFWRVSQNAMFYGLYRREAILDCRMPNILGGDWAWIADVAIRGKTLVQRDVKIRRSAAGTSASYDRIMDLVDTPRSMRRYPSLVLAGGIGAHIALKSSSFRARYPVLRFAIAPLVMAILAYRRIVRPALGRWRSTIRRYATARTARRETDDGA
jgi:glycosyltransferase involved in cell wall biosynthesis